MATYEAFEATSAAPVPGHGMGGNLKVAFGSVELGTAIAANDVVNLCKVPAGAVVFGGFIQAQDLDTGTEALDIDAGWLVNDDEAADPDGFGNFGVWTGDAVTGIKPETGIYYPLGGVLFTDGPKLFTAETTLSLDVNVSPNAGGTGHITLAAFYVINENWTKTSVG